MKEKEKQQNKLKKTESKLKMLGLSLVPLLNISTVYAADDPIAAVNNLTNFIFTLVQSLVAIMLIFGVVQFGMSFKSHDASQRASSVMTIGGGLIICFSKAIITKILG